MSFRRPLISQIHVPRLLPRQAASCHTYGPSNLLNNRLTRVQTRDRLVTTTTRSTNVSSPYIPKCFLSNSISNHRHVKDGLTKDQYDALRAQDPGLVVNLPPTSYLQVLSEALDHNSPDSAERVVSDILENYKGTNVERCSILQQVLSLDIHLLTQHTILRILQYLHASSQTGLSFLTSKAIGGLGCLMLDPSSSHDTDRPFLRLLHPLLLTRLKTLQRPRHVNTSKPPSIVFVTFCAVQKLLNMSFDRHALDLFQALLKSGYVPAEALPIMDNSSEDAELIMFTALIRASLHWNWHMLAVNFMTGVLESPSPNKHVLDLNIDVIYALLDNPNVRNIRACGHLIRRAHTHTPVPHSVIRQFYIAAVDARAKEEAERMYAFTATRHISQKHQYPPPQGVALPWLMFHLTTASSQTHLARTLATEVVNNNLDISIPYRGRFIAAIATKGYGRLARALWERYATGRDAAVVVGNSALMIRMISLFWNIHNATKAELDNPQPRPHKKGYVRDEDLRARSTDANQFVDRVLQSFKLYHAPLAKAPHRALTSLARAYFIVGKIPEGFKVFRQLMSRKEVPDLHDANVALSAIAQLDLQLAADLIGRMADIGLRPDAISFGTVLHYAVLQDNRRVVDAMIQRIRALGDGNLSLKTLTNVIHAIIALAKADSNEALRAKLNNILYMMKSYPEVNIASSSQTAKTLVYHCLRAQDGLLAYTFWKLLLRRGAEWDDEEQRNLRHSIASLIIRPEVSLEAHHRNLILATLGQGG